MSTPSQLPRTRVVGFKPYVVVIAAIVVALSLCSGATVAQGGSAAATMSPSISTSSPASADSLYALVKARLGALEYRIETANAGNRRMVVRAPEDQTKIQIDIAAEGDSSLMTIVAIGTKNLVAAMGSSLRVAHDATMDPASKSRRLSSSTGELPTSQWRSVTFLSPSGRLWSARGAVFSADSLFGKWKSAFSSPDGDLDSNDLSLQTTMAFVSDDTVLIGLGAIRAEALKHFLYRTTNRGQDWSAIDIAELTSVDAMAAIDSSVWLFAPRFKGNTRLAAFRRSEDGGATWSESPLPKTLTDVDIVYRVSPSTAYAATAAYDKKTPAFWVTADGGGSWKSIPTPGDQGLTNIPSYGSRVERIASVGDWLVVREYGHVFVSRADSIDWRPLAGISDFAADPNHQNLFALTNDLHLEMLDRDLAVLWKTSDGLPSKEANNVESLVATNAAVFVTMSHGEIYEARDGNIRVRRPASSP